MKLFKDLTTVEIFIIIIFSVFLVFTIIGFTIITYNRGFTTVRLLVLIALLLMLAVVGTLSVYTYRGTQDDIKEDQIELEAGIGLIVASVFMTAVFSTLMLCFEKRFKITRKLFKKIYISEAKRNQKGLTLFTLRLKIHMLNHPHQALHKLFLSVNIVIFFQHCLRNFSFFVPTLFV